MLNQEWELLELPSHMVGFSYHLGFQGLLGGQLSAQQSDGAGPAASPAVVAEDLGVQSEAEAQGERSRRSRRRCF